MNTYKQWKATAVDALRQEPDRPRHKPFTSLSRHKTPEVRASARDREDSKRRSGRGYVSDGGPLPSSRTPAPTYPTGAQSLATASKAPHNAPTQPAQGHPAHVSQKASVQNNPLPQESLPTTQRYSVTAPDPRATSHRTVAASDKVPSMSPDSTRYVEDHHKGSRHRHRQHPTPALESAEPQPASAWPLPKSFFKKVSPEVREREKERSRNRLKEESNAKDNAKDKGRTERVQEHVSRDQQEWDLRYEEERRRYKEGRRREKERREEEQRHDERRQEQRVKEDNAPRSTRDQERRREPRDGHVPVTSVGKDPRLIRVAVKDSDDSDNSLMKPQAPGSIRPRRHHAKDQTVTAAVPTVLRQPAHIPAPAQIPIAQPENNPASNINESHRVVTSVQPSQATSGSSNEKSSTRPQRASPRQNPTIPYPPGYAVSASDSEHISRREHRTKITEGARSIERPRTSGGHRASVAHDVVPKPPITQPGIQPIQLPLDKSLPKSEKPPKGGFSAWVFQHREPSNSYPKPGDVHMADRIATQPNGRTVPVRPPSTRNDTSDAIPQVVSIRAGEGPPDNMKEYGARHAAPPVVHSSVADAAIRQPLPTVQVLQQPPSSDKQPRDTPRTLASQADPSNHISTTHVLPLRPWVEQSQWTSEPQPLSPVAHPPVVPSPMVFPTSLASPPTLTDAQLHIMSPRPATHGLSNHQESHSHIREGTWQHNPMANVRPPVPPVHFHTTPVPASGPGQRTSPHVAPPMGHDIVGTKHVRHSSVPTTGYTSVQPSYVASPPSRPIAPDLAAAFPIREDAIDAYRRPSQGERPHETQPSKDTFDHWDRHGHPQDHVARMVLAAAPSSERTPRSTKASPSLHPRTVNQGTPPKPPLQSITAHTFPQHTSTTPDVLHAHDPSRPGVYSPPNQNSNPSPYPAAIVYPSSPPPRTQVEANSAINNLTVANASSNNPSPKIKPGNPSPRSRPQVVASSQGPTPPTAVHITTRTPSHETGSTTLLGRTPSSQGSSMQLPMTPQVHPQAIVTRVPTHFGQQVVQPSVPVFDTPGDRSANITTHTPHPPTRQTGSRHHHSNSAPVVSVSPALAQPHAPQMQPLPRVPPPVSPTPVRSYSTTQTLGDAQIARMPVPRYSSTLVPNSRQQRELVPSPSQESELNTPSSLAVSTKLPIISDEPLAPVISTQSLQEPKKKGRFFQGLGIFRSRSSAQKRDTENLKLFDTRATTTATTTVTTTATATKPASSKTPTPLHYDSDSRVVTTASKLKKTKASRKPVTSATPHPPATPVPVPAPSFAAAMEERFSSGPNAFSSIRVMSKRYRTMSGASAEAVDGTNAGASTVLTSPANSTRSPTPKLIPQRDPQQATYAWRNKEEAEAQQRGNARRRRPPPGVHFEGYEDHPQAEHHRYNYAARVGKKVRG